MAGGYTGSRRYVLDNQRLHKHAELFVNVKCDTHGTKHFEILAEEGWRAATEHVLRKMVESEAETSLPQMRVKTRLAPDNYVFRIAPGDVIEGRSVFVIDIAPRRSDKYLFRGRIWVDAKDYALVRAEGEPAKNASFWIRSVHFVQQYRPNGSFWFPSSTDSTTEALIFGRTKVSISYFNYLPDSLQARANLGLKGPANDGKNLRQGSQ